MNRSAREEAARMRTSYGALFSTVHLSCDTSCGTTITENEPSSIPPPGGSGADLANALGEGVEPELGGAEEVFGRTEPVAGETVDLDAGAEHDGADGGRESSTKLRAPFHPQWPRRSTASLLTLLAIKLWWSCGSA